MRSVISSMLVLASLPFLPATVSARALTTSEPCIYVTSFFYTAPLCPVVLTGQTASVQALLSSAVVIGPSDIGDCKEITTNPTLSYQFFVNGPASNCKYTTYTQSQCKGQATVSSLGSDQFKCMAAPLPLGREATVVPAGIMSFKVSCPKPK